MAHAVGRFDRRLARQSLWPQRNDPDEGIPVHAYSPFDERTNREHPCPPDGCDVIPGQVLLKLAPDVPVQRDSVTAAGVLDAQLLQTLDSAGIDRLELDAALWGGTLDRARYDSLADSSSGTLVLNFGNGQSISFDGVSATVDLLDDIVLI